ncbi:MAG: glycosyltransferase family 39 protein [Victivallaceae bacterium]|jgi:4-amino-4-deoxy-L-arabinose transferase-like glycosyltransferase
MTISDQINRAANKYSILLDKWPERKIILSLVVLSLFFRLLTSQFIERSGDAIHKWGVLRCFVETGNWYPAVIDHHMLRWSINFPVLLIQKIFGTSPLVYYIFPCLVSIVCGILIYKITARLSSRTAGIAAFLIFSIFPLTTRESTQFLPMLPACMFILAAIYFLLKWIDKSQIRYVIFAAMAILCAYGSKETSLYWTPGIALFMLLFNPDRKIWFSIWRFKAGPAVILFTVIILTGLLAETAILNAMFNSRFGRLELVSKTHFNYSMSVFYTFWEWLFSFLRPLSFKGKYFDSMPKNFIIILGLISAFLLLFKQKRSIEKQLIAIPFAVAYLLHSYMVNKIFPFHHPEKTHGRYFLALAVFCIIMYAASYPQWHQYIWSKIRNLKIRVLCMAAVIALWLVPTIIQIINTAIYDGTVFNVAVMERKMETAASEKDRKPVLYMLNSRLRGNELSSYDIKHAILIMTVFGPAAEIPAIEKKKYPVVADASDKSLYIVLYPEHPVPSGGQQTVWTVSNFKMVQKNILWSNQNNLPVSLAEQE